MQFDVLKAVHPATKHLSFAVHKAPTTVAKRIPVASAAGAPSLGQPLHCLTLYFLLVAAAATCS